MVQYFLHIHRNGDMNVEEMHNVESSNILSTFKQTFVHIRPFAPFENIN